MFEVVTVIVILFCLIGMGVMFKHLKMLKEEDGHWVNYILYKISLLGMLVCYQVYSFVLPEPRLLRWKFIPLLVSLSALLFMNALRKTQKKIKELRKDLEKYKAFFIND